MSLYSYVEVFFSISDVVVRSGLFQVLIHCLPCLEVLSGVIRLICLIYGALMESRQAEVAPTRRERRCHEREAQKLSMQAVNRAIILFLRVLQGIFGVVLL